MSTSQQDFGRATPEELAELAAAALRALAERADPEAFAQLLQLTQVVGECMATAARNLADERSWSGVGDIAGTTRQAAWARWRER